MHKTIFKAGVNAQDHLPTTGLVASTARYLATVMFLLITSLLIGSAIAASTEDAKKCTIDVDALQKKLWVLLYRDEDYRAAHKLVEKARECASSKYHTAVIAELQGSIGLALHRNTGEANHARDAEKFFSLDVKLDTEHNDVLRWRLATLMKQTKQYEKAVYYLNPLLQKNSKYIGEQLSLALEIAVETKNWDQAKELVDILYSRYRNYFLNLPTLYASVKTMCYYNRGDVAEKFVAAVEKHRTVFSDYDRKLLDKSKAELSGINCKRPNPERI